MSEDPSGYACTYVRILKINEDPYVYVCLYV